MLSLPTKTLQHALPNSTPPSHLKAGQLLHECALACLTVLDVTPSKIGRSAVPRLMDVRRQSMWISRAWLHRYSSSMAFYARQHGMSKT